MMKILLKNRKKAITNMPHPFDRIASQLGVQYDWGKAKKGSKGAIVKLRKELQGMKGDAQELRDELHKMRQNG